MKKGIRAIEITFPRGVEISEARYKALMEVLNGITNDYERKRPDRTMWVFGTGYKLLVNPMVLSDDEPIPFDDSVLSFEISERENYDCPCAVCGHLQQDHKPLSAVPKAGTCDFVPPDPPLAAAVHWHKKHKLQGTFIGSFKHNDKTYGRWRMTNVRFGGPPIIKVMRIDPKWRIGAEPS